MTSIVKGKGSWIKYLIGAAITFLCLGIFIRQINLADMLEAFDRFQWGYLVLGVASLALGYSARIIRWWVMLNAANVNVTVINCSAPFMAAIALNNLLPLRLGDVIRALVFPRAMGITKTTATSSLVVERLVDMMTLIGCLAVGLFAINLVAVPVELKATAVSLSIFGGVALVLGLLFSVKLGQFLIGLSPKGNTEELSTLHKSYLTLGGLLLGFGMMCRPRIMIVILIISVLVWCGEAGLFYFILLGSGIEATPFVALLVMAIATLSTLVPSSPGYVGAFHLAVFTAVSLVGGTAAESGSYAVMVHLALWLPTTLAGAFAIWSHPRLFQAVKAHAS
jgi:hypothetical protein